MHSTVKLPRITSDLPGPKAKSILDRDARTISPSYTRPFPLVINRGFGAVIEDVDKNYFLDFNAGVAVCATGHSHPRIVQAITEQAAKFLHLAAADYYYELLPALGEKLQHITPGHFPKRVHFGNSGAEAVETALKIARYATGRDKFIAFYGAFHGRTLGALSLTASKAAQRRGFGRQLLDVTHIPYASCRRCAYGKNVETCQVECLRVIEELLFQTTVPPEEVAAIIVEPVQGEGGYIVPPKKFFDQLRELRRKYGVLIIADEVQSGMGRTGRFFACEHFQFVPDIITIAKGIASGLPLSATVARDDLMQWHEGAHASTFGGNPVAIAAALATIDLLDGGLLQNCQAMGRRLMQGLKPIAETFRNRIADVRGLGLMIGVEFIKDRKTFEPDGALRDRIVMECFKRGLIIIGCGPSTIRFSPPLVIDAEQVDCALSIVRRSIAAAIEA
jgi:4-aminobutyrate aminotransferase